jgi:hypothetical protein
MTVRSMPYTLVKARQVCAAVIDVTRHEYRSQSAAMNAFWHGLVSPSATSARHRWGIPAANPGVRLAATTSVALIGAAVGMAAGVPGMLAGIVLGGVAGLLAARALARRNVIPVWDDPGGGPQVETDPPLGVEWRSPPQTRPHSHPHDKNARRHARRTWRAMVRWVARLVGAAMMLLGGLSAACGLLWAVDEFYCDPNPQPVVLFASFLSAVLIAVGFAIWAAASPAQHRSA